MPEFLQDIEIPGYVGVIIRVAAVLVGAFVFSRLLRLAIRRFATRLGGDVDLTRKREAQRIQTIVAVLRAGASVVIWLVAGMLAISQTGVNIGPLIATAGIGGIALGFGAQSLVKDLIAGFFILFEDQYHVGDVIEIVGVTGVVEGITLHSTMLRDLDGRRHIVPNGSIEVASNHTSGFSRYLLDLPVPYDVDTDRVVTLANEVLDEMRADPSYAAAILGPLVVLGVNEYAASEVLVKMFIETIPGRQWEIGREFRRRVKKAYDATGISVPFPHREVIVKDAAPQAS